MMSQPQSTGHIMFVGNGREELFEYKGNVYIARTENAIHNSGYRTGARFYAMLASYLGAKHLPKPEETP